MGAEGSKVHHIIAKRRIEEYFRASGIKGSLLRPVAFFENLDDPARARNALSLGAR